ncbi:hypothetical protein GOP47_0026354 [Adiantum capillus-veneris]|nr:hypothetical protein GOP47_0026354 [Adiantum capillus-veneris]
MEVPPLLRLQSTQVLLLWSAIIGLVCYHIHEWTVSLPILLRFFMGVVVGIIVTFLCHLSYWRRERIRKEREAYARQMTSLSKEDLFRLLPEETAKTASLKKPDQFEWLNLELAKAWPSLNDAVSDVVRDQLQPVLDQYKVGALAEMKIQWMSFGSAAPQFLGVKTEEMGEDEASIEADLQWTAEREQIKVKVKTVGPDFKVKVQNIRVMATIKIVLKPLIDTIPGFGAILVSLSGVPVVDFDLKIAEGDANALPGIERMIDNSIRNAVEDMLVWPNRIICPVLPGDYSFLELKPVGILDVFLLKAEGVMNTDILGKSDCFVILFVRKKPERIKRSSTKKNTLNPVWNEGFRIEVDDPQYQILTVQLMDEESVTKAEFIGRATVPLNDLVPHEPKETCLDMMESADLQCTKPRARVQVVLVYEPFEIQSRAVELAENDEGTKDHSTEDKQPEQEMATSQEQTNRKNGTSMKIEQEGNHDEKQPSKAVNSQEQTDRNSGTSMEREQEGNHDDQQPNEAASNQHHIDKNNGMLRESAHKGLHDVDAKQAV